MGGIAPIAQPARQILDQETSAAGQLGGGLADLQAVERNPGDRCQFEQPVERDDPAGRDFAQRPRRPDEADGQLGAGWFG